MCICLQCDGIGAPASLQQHTRHAKVDGRCNDRDEETHTDIIKRLWICNAFECSRSNAVRSQQNQRTFCCTGKVFGFGMAIGVFIIGRAFRYCQQVKCQQRSHQVDKGLHGIGEKADRASEQVGQPLQRNGRDGSPDGQIDIAPQ